MLKNVCIDVDVDGYLNMENGETVHEVTDDISEHETYNGVGEDECGTSYVICENVDGKS